MTPLCNLHTHTNYCDGKNTAEEMVLAAIGLGFETLGFSGHSQLECGKDWCMSEEGTLKYIEEISALKEKYRDRIEIALGIEYDFLSECDKAPFDYIIGSVHHVVKDGRIIPVDLKADSLVEAVGESYGGDFYTFTRDYYDNMYSLCERTECDIVGHFDLVTKFNEGGKLFDESDKRYKDRALDALECLLKKDVIFEINTGAISRGYRKTPYPAEFLLRRMAESGAMVMLNSDTHSRDSISCHFDEAVEYAKYCGVKSLTIMRDGKFTEVKI